MVERAQSQSGNGQGVGKILTCKRLDPRGDGQGVVDIHSGRNKADVMREAQANGEAAHVGRVAELCTVKGSDCDIDNPLRIYKGRDCFLGDQVKTESNDWVVFNEIGTTPPSLDARMAMGARSCFLGFCLQPADATSAYTQA